MEVINDGFWLFDDAARDWCASCGHCRACRLAGKSFKEVICYWKDEKWKAVKQICRLLPASALSLSESYCSGPLENTGLISHQHWFFWLDWSAWRYLCFLLEHGTYSDIQAGTITDEEPLKVDRSLNRKISRSTTFYFIVETERLSQMLRDIWHQSFSL